MADRKITELTAMSAGTQATGDLLTIVDVSEAAAVDKNKKITVENLFKGIPSNVGIGTASPDAKLHVAGELRVDGGSSGLINVGDVTSNYGRIFANSSGTFVGSVTSNPLILRTGNTEAARIDTSGNFGLGTTNPGALLHLRSTGEPKLRIQDADLTNRYCEISQAGGGTVFRSRADTVDGQFIFMGNGGGTDSEAMRIDSSGRLLVGTSAAIGNGADNRDTITAVATAGGDLLFGRNDTSTVDGNNLGKIEFWGNDSNGTYEQCASIIAEADGTHATGDKPTRLVFSTTADGASSPTIRMRIRLQGQAAFHSDSSHLFKTVRTASTQSFLSFQNNASNIDNGTQVCRILADGDLENANNNYGALSDVKLKENIVDAGSQWEDLKAISVRNFNFKEELGLGTNTSIGVVAQELELVSPGLVKTSPDLDADENDLGTTTKSVKYSVLYMKAVKALQEAMTRIETLEAKVAALEAG